MPGGDRTGPMGQGPRTGRGAGYCNDGTAPGYATAPGRGAMGGRGRGRGGGGGRGWRNMFHATGLTRWQRAAANEPVAPTTPPAATDLTVEQELASLQAQADEAVTALDQIRQRIDEIATTQARETQTDE